MTKKIWEKPEIKELNVGKTQYGTSVTVHIDSIFVDGDSTYYSFS